MMRIGAETTVIRLNRFRPHRSELEAFARAVSAVLAIKARYREQILKASTERKADGLYSRCRQEMREAVQREGLTPGGYRRILKAVRDDLKLRRHVRARVASLKKKKKSTITGEPRWTLFR